MPVVSMPPYEPWFVSRWAFRLLLERTLSELSSDHDKYATRQAIALDGMHFDMKEVEQADRIGRAMSVAGDELRRELLAAQHRDARDLELADLLGVLVRQLREVYG